MHPFVDHLHFPTSLALDDGGTIYVAESGLPFDGAPSGGAVSRVGPNGECMRLIEGLRAPVNGLVWHDGSLIISEGGDPGRISRLDLASGNRHTILDHLPGFGNYHVNMARVGPDRKLYFSQGAMTNSGVIGADSNDLAWLGEIRHNCDIPGYDVVPGEWVAVTRGPPPARSDVRTGPFARFGNVVPPGTRIAGKVPCTSAVMRCDLDGGNLELVAWGIRNAYGIGFLADGRLLATDQGADARGVRPISNCPDFLYEIVDGAWYGWPDFFGGAPVTDARFRCPLDDSPRFILLNHAELPAPQKALLEFEVNACAVKFAQVPAGVARFSGDLIVAQFGDERPMTGPPGPRVGRNLVRISTADWSVHPVPRLPFSRPIDIAFTPDGSNAYVVDFGAFEITPDKRIAAGAGTGRIWKLPATFMEE